MISIGLILWLKSKRDGYRSPRAKRNAGILRVAAYGSSLSVLFGVWGMHSAKAELNDKAMLMGRDLAAIADVAGDTTRISLNGQVVDMESGISSLSVKEVLAQYEKRCGEGGSAFADLAHTIDVAKAEAGTQPAASKANPLTPAGVNRQESNGEGVVFCTSKPGGASESFSTAMDAFVATHNLGAFGQIRYAYVHRLANGHTQMLTMSTSDKFDLDAIVPEEGKEAPGRDSEFMPRPPSARRLLSAEITGTPYAVRVYQSSNAAPAVVKFYDDFADANGFTIVPDDVTQHTELGPEVARSAYEKNGVMVIVAAAPTETGATTVSVAEVGVGANVGRGPQVSR